MKVAPDEDAAAHSEPACRGCGGRLLSAVVDLGEQPPAERFLAPGERADAIPLSVSVCRRCWLVQLDGAPVHSGDEPGGLAFSVSPTMRRHAAELVERALDGAPSGARVVEIGSHGNRLTEWLALAGADAVLVEPDEGYAAAARAAGARTVNDRLTAATAERLRADGFVADRVVDAFYLAHDPDPVEILVGIRAVLAPDGRAVLELDHLLPIVDETQFDAIRHGHASYLSLLALTRLLELARLSLVDASIEPVYGGSLRVVVTPAAVARPSDQALAILDAERDAGLDGLDAYAAFGRRVGEARVRLRSFFDELGRRGSATAAYGAPSRGNTLLNSSAITQRDIPFTVDRSPAKQGLVMPGSGIPIDAPERLGEAAPDYVLVLPWDLRDEIAGQLAGLRARGTKLVVPLPELELIG